MSKAVHQTTSEEKFRKVKIPKQNWNVEDEKPKISKEIMSELKTMITEFSENRKVDAHQIQSGLRAINFHKENPEIYAIIEKMCLESDISGKSYTVDEFIGYLNNTLGDNTSRAGVSKIFESVANPKLGEITPETLHKAIETIGDELSREDVEYLMKIIAEPSKDINISSDEFYYIMTKRPADVDMITSVTKKINA